MQFDVGISTVSVMITIADIVCAFVSVCGAISACRYKASVQKQLDMMKVMEYCIQFRMLGQEFTNRTRGNSWFRGCDPNFIINPLSNHLNGFGNVYSIIGKTRISDKINEMISKLHSRIQEYVNTEEQTDESKAETNKLIHAISVELDMISSSYSKI